LTRKPVFAVLGGGNGGFCMAADLTLRGFKVRLFELPAFAHTIEPVLQKGGIALRGVAGEGFARPALVTTNIEAALAGADVVMVVVPAMGHKAIAQACAPFLQEGQMMALTPGCCGGALEFRHTLRAAGGQENAILAETTSLMYAVKKEGGNGVWARGIKQHLPLAAFPAHHTAAVIERLSSAFPQFAPAANVLETSFGNLNHITHPATMLMNLGFIESRRIKEWFFYTDGYTPGTGRVADQLDVERLAVARAYGLPEIPAVELIRRFYGHQGMAGSNLYEMFNDSPVHRTTRGPRSARSRLISEDIPYGLVPLASFGRLAGAPTPTMDALITLASVVNQTDYRRTGRTVESLGLAGLDVDEIVQLVTGRRFSFTAGRHCATVHSP